METIAGGAVSLLNRISGESRDIETINTKRLRVPYVFLRAIATYKPVDVFACVQTRLYSCTDSRNYSCTELLLMSILEMQSDALNM